MSTARCQDEGNVPTDYSAYRTRNKESSTFQYLIGTEKSQDKLLSKQQSGH